MTDITTVERLAGAIAAEIREKGHWQNDRADSLLGSSATCVGLAKAWGGSMADHPSCVEFVTRVGVYRPLDFGLGSSLRGLYDWNDSHTTVEVLATLDAIAASGEVVAEAEAARSVAVTA